MMCSLCLSVTFCVCVFIGREYKILNLLEFNSTRKRMSVVVRDEAGRILVMCKGADRWESNTGYKAWWDWLSWTILFLVKQKIVKTVSAWKWILFLFCSIIYDRLGKEGKGFWEATKEHLAKYGDAGLRTLAIAYRQLEESEYTDWNQVFVKAKTTIGANRDELLEQAAERIEQDLFLLGATAVEDKLQKGVSSIS